MTDNIFLNFLIPVYIILSAIVILWRQWTAARSCKELNQCRADIIKKDSELAEVFNSINEQSKLLEPYILLNNSQNAQIEKLNKDIAEQNAILKYDTMQLRKYKLEIAVKDAVIQNIETKKAYIIRKLNAQKKKFDTESNIPITTPQQPVDPTNAVTESYLTFCRDLGNSSGIHTIKVKDIKLFNVTCESRFPGGPDWTVIMRRGRSSAGFDRNWQEYKDGFGDLNEIFWLGLEKIHLLTSSQPYEVYVDFEEYNEYSHYDIIEIGNEAESYKLKLLGKYTGNYGDILTHFEQMKFTTRDRDNGDSQDRNCAVEHGGGWWHNGFGFSFTSRYIKVPITMMIRPKQS